MIIFLHGPNSFNSRQKLNEFIEQFKRQRDPYGDNVVILDGEQLTIDALNAKTASQSLLAQKRLVVIHNLFDGKKEDTFDNLPAYLENFAKHNDNSIIFYENRELNSKKFGAKKLTAARKKLFNFLNSQKYSKKFENLNGRQINDWVEDKFRQNAVAINRNDLMFLTNFLENDQFLIDNEINKLLHFAKAKNQNVITQEDIKNLAKANIDDNIFSLTDAISANDKPKFFLLLEDQLSAGASEQQILSMLIRQFKIILQIKEMLLMKKNQNEIAGEIKQHPFVVKKTVPQTRNFNIEYLKKIIAELIDIDYQMKTGQIDGLTGLNLLFAE